MDIKTLVLENIGPFKSLEIKSAPLEDQSTNITVILGENGAGKTSILKGLATALSWLVARIRTEKSSGSPLPELAITNSENSGAIRLIIQDENNAYTWTLARTRKGKKAKLTSELKGASLLAEKYRAAYSTDEKAGMPLIAYYPVERVVLDIPLKIRGKHTFLQLDGYENALNQGVDFRRFFEWYREREDTENESSVPQEILDKLLAKFEQSALGNRIQEELAALAPRDKQLLAVRKAIQDFMPGFTNLRVRRKPRLHMSIDKDH